MTRRTLISSLATLPCCLTNAVGQEWNYREAGPDKWATLDHAFAACSSGDQQSPIDLHDGVKAELPALSLDLPDNPLSVLNNGRTIQVSSSKEGSVRVGQDTLKLVQVHFHTPSEHAINGRAAAMEVHFVHAHRDQSLTVLSALLTADRPNAAFAAIMDVAPTKANAKAATAKSVKLRELLPGDIAATWRYEGSLTTPPCSQTVDWIVFDQPVSVAQADIDRFRKILPMNARPRQPLNRRYILRT